MAELVVIAFPNEASAEGVSQKLLAMQKEYLHRVGGCRNSNQRRSGSYQTKPATQYHDCRCGFWHLLGSLIGLIFLMPLAGAAIGAASGALGVS
jgi:uncharacterized membrane protein